MVVSKIDNSISYPESRIVMAQDKELKVELYSIVIKDINVVIAIGSSINTYTKKNIIYYPIYMIKNNNKAVQIGLYEIQSSNLLTITDENGELDLDKLDNPLIYVFATKKFILDNRLVLSSDEDTNEDKSDNNTQEPEIDTPNNNEETVNFKDAPPLSIPRYRADIFVLDSNVSVPQLLSEETKAQSQKINSDFEAPKKTHNAYWLQTVMKNNHYDTIENEGGGDCLFSVIRDAFASLGQMTTVEKLRQKLSLEASEELFNNYANHYELSSKVLLEESKKIKILQNEYKKYEEKVTMTISSTEQQEYVNNAKHIAIQYQESVANKKLAQELYSEFKFMKGVKSLDELQKKIQTPDYWADTWAISTLERILNIKFIILSSEYAKKDVNNMMQCGMNIDNIIESRGIFEPEFYIMTEHTGQHYRIISYREKQIFKYKEIPYDIKNMIITKCVERNSGPFILIPEFRKLTEVRDGDSLSGIDEPIDLDILTEIDPNIIFQYYDKSMDKSAGKGTGEKIEPIERKLEFAKLSPKGEYPNWRRKLDNKWVHPDKPFEIDNYNWNSVEHYIQASKFKRNFPDFYRQFAVESNTDISKDLSLATAAGSKSGKKEETQVRPTNIEVDPEFGGKQEELATYQAMNAKFSQVSDFKGILLATKNATINKYTPGTKASVDKMMILVRKDLLSNMKK
jgi:predicted NAD-dependent protein-ADP-ribosyltransferase YbiA (DUF1768 family)